MKSPCRAPVLSLVLVAVLGARADAVKCPNLQLIVDRSGSMTIPLGRSTRWATARGVLQTLLDNHGGRVPIGLTLYPSGNSCSVGKNLAPALNSKREIIAALDEQEPDGGTPTHAAILRAAQQAALRDPARKQYMILLTDGLPECDGDPSYTVEATVAALQAARAQTPKVETFVIGFAGVMESSLVEALRRMAEAGGRPAPTADKFYRADDELGLQLALQQILESVNDEFGGKTCDESCETQGCPEGGVCLRHECVRDPCQGFDCGPDGFCYTDGVSPGVCRKACLTSCPAGTRCSMGTCVEEPCGNVCLPGTICNAAARRCELDPQCKAPGGPACEAPAQCQGGRCALDPCLFVRCPPGSDCTPWDGSCAASGKDLPMERARGCAASPGQGAGPGGLLLLGLGLLLLGRRRAGRR